MTKKTLLIPLLAAFSLSATALDFFGIEYNGNTADNIINLIYCLTQHDTQQADLYYRQLKKTSPLLAKKLKIDDLKIPCTTCTEKGVIEKKLHCPDCQGAGLVTDEQALGYLQYKFSSAIDSGRSDHAAWKQAKSAFDKRREAVLSFTTISGTIIRREKNGVLLTLQDGEEIVYLKNLNMASIQAGATIGGLAWPSGDYTYQPNHGEPIEITCYTATLWAD